MRIVKEIMQNHQKIMQFTITTKKSILPLFTIEKTVQTIQKNSCPYNNLSRTVINLSEKQNILSETSITALGLALFLA
jgi:hypothetical protein